MPDPQDPIRQQLIAARCRQILDAAAKVFTEKGFHQATTREIARTAGIAEGTIYNYFDSKGDLLIGLMMRLGQVEHLDEELTEALDEDARDFLLAIARHRMAMVDENHETLQAILPEVLVNPDLRERFYQQFARPMALMLEQYVQARVETGEIEPGDVPLAVRSVQAMFLGLLVMRILGDETLLSHWDEMPGVLTALIFDGLSAGKEGA